MVSAPKPTTAVGLSPAGSCQGYRSGQGMVWLLLAAEKTTCFGS